LGDGVATDVKEDVLTVFNEEQTVALKAFGPRRQYRWKDELTILRCSSSLRTDTLGFIT
jgi:hypothetical protein